jgi:NAD-specific glutamate dehydrogenase
LGAPADLSFDVALVRALASSCEILDISQKSGWGLKDVAIMHHAVGSRLRIDELRAAARDASADDEWERLAIQRIADELPRQQAELTLSVIESTGTRQRKDGASSAEMCRTEINSWLLPRSASSDRLSILLETASGESGWTLAKLVLLSEAVREIVHSCRRPLGAA